MKKHLLVSNLDNHNIGVLKIEIDAEKINDIRSAIYYNHKGKLQKMIAEEFGIAPKEIKFKQEDIKVHCCNPIKVTVNTTDTIGADEFTLEETWVY